ncbi:hypothetical protein FYK55_25675 [Roseiconus nitratireducens]|uniref:Membrane protein containing DUF1355 n=1 Tax=Roseiconus nitratireducens TaxID=2605748 RepID=A0A5M6CUW9_9BACT|nr:hypothetical protein [Roseiconus nitratireducens]KAA5538991.1 hypothetical protein FYK55_25675 [Roseiconus nitratireducens]
MNATETIRNEYLAFGHPFSLPSLILVGLACLAIMLGTLYRERRVLGRRTTLAFSALRIVAVATVFWMLLAPTNVLEESTTTRKAVVMVADASASMTIVDPQGSADDRRWFTVENEEQSNAAIGRAIALTDRAIAAMGIAHRELSDSIAELQQHGTQQEVNDHLARSSRAVTRARGHLAELADLSPGLEPSVDRETDVASLLRRLNGLLESPEFDSLADLADALNRGGAPKEMGWREGLPDLTARVVTTRRVFQELATQLVSSDDLSSSAPASDLAIFRGRSRSERLANYLDHFQRSAGEAIDQSADLRWSAFASGSQDFSGDSDATRFLKGLRDREDVPRQTDLSSALRHVQQLAQRQPIAATFVLSDVAHNHSEAAGPTQIAAQLKDTPVYMVPIGNPSRLRDVDLVSVSAPTVAMRNDDVVIEAHLGIYQCLGETCTIQLLRDGEVVDFRNVLVDSDSESRSIRFDQRVSEIGRETFQIAVQPVDGEMTTENNFDEIEINVTRSDIKVLLADEMPRWEYRYLAQLFRRDPKVELDELLFHPRQIATGRREPSGTFPVTVDQWNQYDVVILGDLPVEHLPVASQESLIKYLRSRGGTLIMIAGDRSMPQNFVDYPLKDVVPVRPIDAGVADATNYAFRVTEAGRSHAALMIGETEQATRDAWDFVNRFSPLHKVSRWRTPLPTARSLIAAVPRESALIEDADAIRESAFLCWQPVGRGRAVYLSGPDTYRLRFLRGDRLHYRFWGQLMRWAIASDLSAGDRTVRIRTGKSLYETDSVIDVEVELNDADGEPVVRDDLDDDALSLQVASADTQREVPLSADPERPGVYRAELRSLPPGVYQAEPKGSLIDTLRATESAEPSAQPDDPIATFTVQADLPAELVDTRCNRVLAGQLAELTGGQVLPPTAIEEVLALTDLEPVVTHHVGRQPLWLRWRYLWLVFGCLQVEWIVRKWRGLS